MAAASFNALEKHLQAKWRFRSTVAGVEANPVVANDQPNHFAV